ncbi:hypothetical protein B4589_011840 [Halolamina sp. CBA1230]|uniref:hypothetical protein n=1 Tax=Halolamina sp. CBA1230 TaxID=1853690 RepID=UPI001301F24D|nr:hypothetical protein [Halolamina sp. CBA1230]QKY21033.1 hypothetical protein B4589_011840 [Halolamina sp. CBA1230]
MPDVSRRSILRGVTFAGAASLGGASGVGTYAYLTDGELFRSNAMAGGSLDLEIATRTESESTTSYTPEQDGSFPSTFVPESTITVAFPAIDPSQGQTSGSTTVAFRVCENPGRVWLRLQDGESGTLADAMEVTLTYAPAAEEAGDTLYEGSLSELFDAYGEGSLLGAGNCRELGKIELTEDPAEFVAEGTGESLPIDAVPGTLTLDGPDGPVDVEITGLHWKDDGDEVRGVDLRADAFEFCRVDVKGGGGPDAGVVTYRPDCAATAKELVTESNPAGRPSGLSHFVIFECAGDSCVGCEPACLTLDWRLPNPKPVAGESVSFDLELFASQCRHTNPRNPWQ